MDIYGQAKDLNLGVSPVLDETLSEYRPFGESTYIQQQFVAFSMRRLRQLGGDLPSAAALADALDPAEFDLRYRTLADTVCRCCIDRALRRVMTGAEYELTLRTCDHVFRVITQNLAEPRPDSAVLADLALLDAEHHHTRIWSDGWTPVVFADTLRSLVISNYGEAPLWTPDTGELAMLRQGIRLLDELLPRSSDSALSHTHLLAVFTSTGPWKFTASSSSFGLGGIIFLRRDLLRNPWWIAEHIFHEALHQKLYEFRCGHTLLQEDTLTDQRDPAANGVGITVPWNSPGLTNANYWDTHRAIAAYHVYVQLSLLCAIAEDRAAELEDAYGPIAGAGPPMTRAVVALDRAHFLREKIRETCWPELGKAGQLLVDWLTSILWTLDPSVPPKGAQMHLLFNRYLREAANIEGKRSSSAPSSELAALTDDEIQSTRAVLCALEADEEASEFESALGQMACEAANARFPEVRRLIARTLLGLSPDGYTFRAVPSGQTTPEEMVHQMVERSSRKLAEAQALRWGGVGRRQGISPVAVLRNRLERSAHPGTDQLGPPRWVPGHRYRQSATALLRRGGRRGG